MANRSNALTHPGKKRPKNEDYVCASDEHGIYVLCDGVGGSHHSGEVASKTAAGAWLEAVKDWNIKNISKIPQMQTAQIAAYLNQITQDVNQKVHDLQGMATTLDGVWLHGNFAWLCHVGDSRIYLLRAGKLYQITEDQTYENEWISTGECTAEEAKKRPHAKTLTQAIGAQVATRADIRRVELMDGDSLLLCSDGLTKMVDDSRILELLKSSGSDLSVASKKLIDCANENGGADNISVILINYEGQPQVVETAKPSVKPITKPNAQLKVEALSKIAFFEGLEYAELLKFLEIAEMENFRPGDCLTEEGTPGDEMFVILSGEVEVYREGKYLLMHGAGVSIGEMGVLDGAERSATVRARDEVVTLVFSREKFMSLLKANPHLANKVMWKIVIHLISLTRRMTGSLVSQVQQQTKSK